MKTLEITIIPAFSGLSVVELLKIWLIPKTERHLIRMEKRLTVNAQQVNFDFKVKMGDRVVIQYQEREQTSQLKNHKLIEILYEDAHLIVVNKPCGMKTHENKAAEINLKDEVSAYCSSPVYVVHRLDQETSGAVLFAKNRFVLPILSSMLEKRQIHREYLALVVGSFTQKEFTINKKIGRDRHHANKRIVSSSGKSAVTHVTVMADFSDKSLVSCQLETGRTHQIRVHLSTIGHPIIGDPLYGKKEKRLMLHAQKIMLTQPFTHEKIEIIAESHSFDKELNFPKEIMN